MCELLTQTVTLFSGGEVREQTFVSTEQTENTGRSPQDGLKSCCGAIPFISKCID